MKAFKKVTNKISNSKIIKNPVFLVIGLIAIILVIALIYFIFLKYSPIMNFKYEGYAISGKDITENLLGSSEDSTTNKNLELTKIEEQGTIFKKLNDYFVGSKEKTEINLNYPIYINNNSAIYNLAESSTLISKDFEQVTGYPNLSISEGKVYDGNNLERADAKEYIFVKTTDEIYINLYEIQIKTTANEYTIPVNSILAFTENSIRYYTVNNNVLVFNEINDVDSNSSVQMVENNYTYEDLLTNLGILQKQPTNTENNESQTNIIKEDSTNSKAEENQQNEVEQDKTEETEQEEPQNGYIKPEVSAEDFTAEVYTAKSILTIKDSAGRIVEAPTFEIYKDNKIYLRRTFNKSGEIQITGLVPETEYKIVGKYIYLNEDEQKVENTFYEGTFTTKGYDELGSIDIQKENGEIFSNKIQLTKVKITSDLNAEVIKGINQVEIETGEIRTVLKNNQVSSLLRGEEITIESSEGLKSNSKINYAIKFYDKNGIELKVNNNTGETRTSKEAPVARVNVKEQDIVSVTLGLKLTNRDNVKLENYKYVVTRPNGEVAQEKRLAENETELLLEDLDQNQYYKIGIYADYDLNDNKGKQENVEIGNLVFATQPISTLGSLELTVENKELTSTTSIISYKIDEDKTDKRLIQILNELAINIKDGENIVKTDTLTEEIENLRQAGTKEIKYENLQSNTTYTIEITGNVQLGNTQENIQVTYNYKEFTTLKIPAKVEIRNQFVTGNLIDFDVRIDDLDNSVLNNKVRMELRNSSNDLIDLQEITTNEDFIRKTYEKLEENQTYKLSFYADQYNEGNTNSTYQVNYLIKEIEIITEPGISGSIGLTELSRKATGKNLVDMNSETKWYVYPNFNTGDYYGKEYNAETKTLTLGGHGNWRRAVYDLREYTGQEVTMSFKAKQVDDSYVETYIQNSKTDVNRTQIQGLTTEWQEFQYTLTVDSTGYLGFYVQSGNGIEIKELQVELGNKKTSYEEFKYILQSNYSINLEDRRDEITTNDYYIKVYEDNNLVKTDRYEEIPEENVITNAIKTYETQTGKEYKVELVIKIKDREYVISELEYNTQDSEEIKGIYNKEDFLEIQPRGHYIVLGDIDIGEENYAFGNGSLFFEGTINFNGYKLILKDSINHLIKNISTSGVIENIVIDAYMTKSSFQALIESNYGTIRNLQFNIISDENVTLSYIQGLMYQNFGTVSNFIINIKNNTNIRIGFKIVDYNSGTIKNGYIIGKDINASTELEQGAYKDIGGIVYYNYQGGEIKNIFSLINIKLGKGEYIKNAGTLVDYNNAIVKNVYSVGDIIDNSVYYGHNIARIDINSQIENSYDLSNTNYIGGVNWDKKTTKLALYDKNFQNNILNEEESFNINENIDNGYYPKLNMPECMPAQTYISLPELTDADLPDIIYTEILEQTNSTAKVKLIVNNPSAETITEIKVKNIESKIVEQNYDEGQSEVIVELYNPIIYTSEYSVISITTKGAFNQEYTRNFQDNERTLQIEMYKEVNSVEDWFNINKSLNENYILMQDLDFINNPDKVKITGEFNGKIKGNDKTIKNIQINNGNLFGRLNRDAKIENLTIENYKATETAGGIIGELHCTIEKIFICNASINKTQITDNKSQGILVDYNYGYIYNCGISNTEIVDNTTSNNSIAGGMIGCSYGGRIENCYVQNIEMSIKNNYTYDGIGGLIGKCNSHTAILNSYVIGNIQSDASKIGGIIGNFLGGIINQTYSAVNISAEGDFIGGICGYSSVSNQNITNNISFGNLYTNVNTTYIDGIIGNNGGTKNNYTFEGQTINGRYLYENSLTREQLINKNTYINIIKLGQEFSYEATSEGKLPLLKEKQKDDLLYNQKLIDIPSLNNITIDEVTYESNSGKMQALITINNPENKDISNIIIDDMKISQQKITNRENKTYISLTATPTRYYSTYKISQIDYIEEETTKSINIDYRIDIEFYKEIYNISDWQDIELGTYQNYKLMNNIDFKNMENIKTNVTMNKFISNNNQKNTLANIKINSEDENKALISKVKQLNNIRFENINISNNTSANNGGIILTSGTTDNCDFVNINIDMKNVTSVACISVMQNDISNIIMEGINISGSNYVGGLVGTANSNIVQLITMRDIHVKGNNYTGGLVGFSTGYVWNVEAEETYVEGNEYVGGIAGHSNINGNSIDDNSINVGKVSGNSYVGGTTGYGKANKNIISNMDILGVNYVGGIAGILNDSNENRNLVNNTNVKATGDYVGGITGLDSQDNVSSNVVTATVIEGKNYVGGLIGKENRVNANYLCDMSNNYTDGLKIVSNGNYVGGLIGFAQINIKNNYSVNSEIIGINSVGGILGEQELGVISNNYTNNNVSGEENIGGLVGKIDNSKTTDTVYITEISSNYVADSKISGTQNVGGLIGATSKEIDDINYYSNYIQADLSSSSETLSLGIGSIPQENLKLKDTYYYKYSKINGINPNEENELFITRDKYLVADDLKRETVYISKLKWTTSNWNFSTLVNNKYPILNTTSLTEQEGIYLPIDEDNIVNSSTNEISVNSLENEYEVPEQTFEYNNKTIQTYSTYSVIKSEDGSQATRNAKLYVKDNTLYAIPSVVSTNEEIEIVPVANNLIIDSYNGKDYETVLGSDGKIYDLKEPITYPENFVNSDIESIGNNLNNDSHEVEVTYKNGDKIKFNYQTGEVISSSEAEDTEKTGLFDYLKEKISEIGNSNSGVPQEITNKYEESKELQTKLEETSVEEAIEKQNIANSEQGTEGVTATENNVTNNSLKENKYISMYNEEKGQYEIYSEEELLDTSQEEVVSENEKIEANNLSEYYASEGETKNTKMGIVWIVISIIGVGIILFVLRKNLKKKNA